MNKCDVCGTEWESQTQNHRRGQDCVQVLAAEVAKLKLETKKLDELLNKLFTELGKLVPTMRKK